MTPREEIESAFRNYARDNPGGCTRERPGWAELHARLDASYPILLVDEVWWELREQGVFGERVNP